MYCQGKFLNNVWLIFVSCLVLLSGGWRLDTSEKLSVYFLLLVKSSLILLTLVKTGACFFIMFRFGVLIKDSTFQKHTLHFVGLLFALLLQEVVVYLKSSVVYYNCILFRNLQLVDIFIQMIFTSLCNINFSAWLNVSCCCLLSKAFYLLLSMYWCLSWDVFVSVPESDIISLLYQVCRHNIWSHSDWTFQVKQLWNAPTILVHLVCH